MSDCFDHALDAFERMDNGECDYPSNKKKNHTTFFIRIKDIIECIFDSTTVTITLYNNKTIILKKNNVIRFKVFGYMDYGKSIAFKYNDIVNKDEFEKEIRYHSMFIDYIPKSIFEDRYELNKWQTLAMENTLNETSLITKAKNLAFTAKDDKTKQVISELLHEIDNLRKQSNRG